MPYNRAVNVMGFAYHYFTIKPGLFEARVFIIIRKIRLLGRILFTKKDCRTNYLVRQPLSVPLIHMGTHRAALLCGRGFSCVFHSCAHCVPTDVCFYAPSSLCCGGHESQTSPDHTRTQHRRSVFRGVPSGRGGRHRHHRSFLLSCDGGYVLYRISCVRSCRCGIFCPEYGTFSESCFPRMRHPLRKNNSFFSYSASRSVILNKNNCLHICYIPSHIFSHCTTAFIC